MQTVISPEAVPGQMPNTKRVPDLRLIILGLCAAAFLLAWLPRMHWGFWTDEAGTFWMACEGWRQAIDRTTDFPGQSMLYSILESFFVSAGFWEEPLLRIPSIVAIVAAAWQLKRLAELLIDKSAGWLTLVPFICAPDIVSFGTSARPYALALAASLASFRYLVEWQQDGGEHSGRWPTLAKYLAVSVLTLHLHYLFGFIFVIQGAYLTCCWIRGLRVRLALPLTALILLPASLLPVLRALRSTSKTTEAFANAAKPESLQLLQICFPLLLLLGVALGALLVLASARNLKWRPAAVRPEAAFLVLSWLALAPLTFFLVARFTQNSVFAARYLLFTLPAFVLIVTWAVGGLERQHSRLTLLIALFASCVLHPAMLMQAFRESPASWREPLEQIQKDSLADAAPLFVASGMANSGGLAWQDHNPSTSPLYAPLSAYPIANQSIPLPYQYSPKVQEFIRAKMQGELGHARRILLLAQSDSPLGPWMSGYLQQLGYRAETRDFNDFVVFDFRRR